MTGFAAGSVRTVDDELVLGLVRRLVAGEVTATDVANALFAMPDATGLIVDEALHIAAEATSEDDLGWAFDAWLELLASNDHESITATTDVVVDGQWQVTQRPTTITAAMNVPATVA